MSQISSYLFNTPSEQQQMLAQIGVKSVNDLFAQIPAALRLNRPLNLPAALTELELETHLRALASRNVNTQSRICFLGGGTYDHFVPAVVDEIVSRGEFYTAYTPYQPEASQGSLQAFFEFQTLICQLTGMDVSNASLYEGGTAVSEAAFMAMRVTDRHSKIVILGSVHPEYAQVLRTYVGNLDCQIVTVPTPQGTADLNQVKQVLDDKTACLIIQQPNFFGCLEEARELCELAHQHGCMAVVSFDPLSLGVLARPGDYGADIAVAEGQSLGIPMQFGGPFLGILACRQDFVRKMPGRLIGITTDRAGRQCCVLNLQTREQHIRREKATSNICTNQGLLALRATIHLCALGPQGIREAAELSCRKAHYAQEQLKRVAGIDLLFDRPFFKEFTVKSRSPEQLQRKAAAAGFDIGPATTSFPAKSGLADSGLIIAVTEKRTRDEIDRLAASLK